MGSEESDRKTALRMATILNYLDTQHWLTSKQILAKIDADGTSIFRNLKTRTITRDFEALRVLDNFIEFKREGVPYLYRLGSFFFVKGIDKAMAFAMSEIYLKKLMPISTLEQLEPYFNHSKKIIEANKNKAGREKKTSKWLDKVSIISRGISYVQPEYDNEILTEMVTALYNERKVEITYLPHTKPLIYKVSVLGMVVKNEVIYFVLSSHSWEDNQQVRFFPVHRIKKVVIDTAIATYPKNFELAGYISNNPSFSFPLEKVMGETIKFEGVFYDNERRMFKQMQELKLSEDQTITPVTDTQFLLTATVKNNSNFLWWLLGLGGLVEVKKPELLRERMITEINQMKYRYDLK